MKQAVFKRALIAKISASKVARLHFSVLYTCLATSARLFSPSISAQILSAVYAAQFASVGAAWVVGAGAGATFGNGATFGSGAIFASGVIFGKCGRSIGAEISSAMLLAWVVAAFAVFTNF